MSIIPLVMVSFPTCGLNLTSPDRLFDVMAVVDYQSCLLSMGALFYSSWSKWVLSPELFCRIVLTVFSVYVNSILVSYALALLQGDIYLILHCILIDWMHDERFEGKCVPKRKAWWTPLTGMISMASCPVTSLKGLSRLAPFCRSLVSNWQRIDSDDSQHNARDRTSTTIISESLFIGHPY